MEIIVFLSIVIAVVAVLTSIVLVRRVKKQIAEMTDVLVDVKNGNGNRRILSATNELTAPLAYEINEIVVAYERGRLDEHFELCVSKFLVAVLPEAVYDALALLVHLFSRVTPVD
jgi:signal transduction histidine kinase